MNDQTSQLLEKLAAKMGTTVEYLWAVLIRQAALSATTDLLYLIFVIIGGFFLWKLHKKLCKENEGGESVYEKDPELIVTPMICAALVWVVLFFFAFFSIGDILSAYINPEYWALEKVLETVK